MTDSIESDERVKVLVTKHLKDTNLHYLFVIRAVTNALTGCEVKICLVSELLSDEILAMKYKDRIELLKDYRETTDKPITIFRTYLETHLTYTKFP